MSTYWNENKGRYENFESALMHRLKSVGDKLETAAEEGQISVVAGVRYDTDAQGLTDTQQENARTNIGAAPVATVDDTTLVLA